MLQNYLVMRYNSTILFFLFLMSSDCFASGLKRHALTRTNACSSIIKGFDELINELYAENSANQMQFQSHQSLDQALADLYLHNPQLLNDLNEIEEKEEQEFSLLQSVLKNKKQILHFIADWGPISYVSFQLYRSYNEIYCLSTEAQDNLSWLQKAFFNSLPTIVNVPNHIRLFLGGAELLVKAYLAKLLLKMIIFCLL